MHVLQKAGRLVETFGKSNSCMYHSLVLIMKCRFYSCLIYLLWSSIMHIACLQKVRKIRKMQILNGKRCLESPLSTNCQNASVVERASYPIEPTNVDACEMETGASEIEDVWDQGKGENMCHEFQEGNCAWKTRGEGTSAWKTREGGKCVSKMRSHVLVENTIDINGNKHVGTCEDVDKVSGHVRPALGVQTQLEVIK